MSSASPEGLSLGPDPLVSPSSDFAERLRSRLDQQHHIQQHIHEARGRPSIVPYLAVANAPRAIEFYASVFGARLVGEPFVDSSSYVTHAELDVGGTTLYLSDEFPEAGIVGPGSGSGNPVSLVIEVADADRCMEAAVASGAQIERPVQDQWDSRSGWFIDPFGHRWSPTSHAIPSNTERGQKHHD